MSLAGEPSKLLPKFRLCLLDSGPVHLGGVKIVQAAAEDDNGRSVGSQVVGVKRAPLTPDFRNSDTFPIFASDNAGRLLANPLKGVRGAE